MVRSAGMDAPSGNGMPVEANENQLALVNPYGSSCHAVNGLVNPPQGTKAKHEP